MINKRAMLLAEETLKIIIALIAISFLVYFLVSLYFNSTHAQKLEQAQASLERIKEVAGNTQILSENVLDITPSGWHLFSFIEDKKPNLCFGQDCLCICPNTWFNQESKCDTKGICEQIENLEYFEEIKIKSPSISLEIIKTDEKVVIYEK